MGHHSDWRKATGRLGPNPMTSIPRHILLSSIHPDHPKSGLSTTPAKTRSSSCSSSPCSTATSLDDLNDIDRINHFRPMYDSSATVTAHFDDLHVNNGESSNVVSKDPGYPGKGKRRFPEEDDEDILRETNDRFVLFPIKYNQVSCTSPQQCIIAIRLDG